MPAGQSAAPPDAREAVDEALLAALRAWCNGGAFPVLTEPLRVASITPRAGVDAAAAALAGSHELARMDRWRGLWWRLQILWREVVVGHRVQPGDPWDCGWWRGGPLGPVAAFRPRRPTLLMLREPDPAVATALLATLRACSPSYDRPLRVLVVSAAAVAGTVRGETLQPRARFDRSAQLRLAVVGPLDGGVRAHLDYFCEPASDELNSSCAAIAPC